MYLSEMIDAVELKTGEELFPSEEERKTDPPTEHIANIPKAEHIANIPKAEHIANIPKAENVEPPDNLPESTLEQEEQ